MTPAKLKLLITETVRLEADIAPQIEQIALNKKTIIAAVEKRATATETGGKVFALQVDDVLGVTVSWPVASIRFPKGVDMAALTSLCGASFSKLFYKLTLHKPVKEFRAVAKATLKAPARKKLLAIFESENPPKVTFKRTDPPAA